jgi:CheY-like chemotaxis protein/two-component sensor histidine kinase
VQHLSGLVDDLLDVSRLTRGKVSLRKERVLLADLVARAVEQASPLLEQQSHALTLEVPRDEVVVNVDARRMSQVFANLLTNAAKYTEPGGSISIVAERQGAHAVVHVRDTGIGIPSELLPRVFDLFYQERQSAERSAGGLGLGLTIVRHFVELHDGTVTASSDGRGRGAEFVVRLPLAEDASQARKESGRLPPPLSERGARVLIVDDNADAADLLAESLQACGYSTHTASDGLTALKAVGQFVPDVALLDIGLPAMDGYELAQRLRASLPARRLLIYAITGYGQVQDRERSRAAGFAGHLIKPVDVASLDRTLREALGRVPPEKESDPPITRLE